MIALDAFAQWNKVLATKLSMDASLPATALWHYARAKAYLAKNDRTNAHSETGLFDECRVNITFGGAAASNRMDRHVLRVRGQLYSTA